MPEAEREEYLRFDVPGYGYLNLATQRQSMAAHCLVARHGLCRTNRKVVGQGLRGRPIGFLVAWLQAGPALSPEAHALLALRPEADNPLISLAARTAAREWAEANVPAALGFERPQRTGEPKEPPKPCY